MDISRQTDAETSSESLMLDYAAGNADAFTELYGLHKGPLFRFILRQGIPSSKADELFQDIWLKVINARDRYQQSARFQTWLYSIARNHLIDEFRKNSKAESIELSEQHIEDQHSATAENEVIQNRKEHDLLVSIKELPFEQRQAFLLKFEAGMTSQDIAMITGTNKETAKSRVRYAIDQLKIKLGGSP